MEKNLSLLATFPRKLDDGFEQLAFGVWRQVITRVREAARVRDRREAVIHLKLTLDNGCVQHLGDELDAVENVPWTDPNGDGETTGGGFDEAVAPYGQSGPRWRPRQDSNL